MEEKKLTKKDYYSLIKDILEATEIEAKDELLTFVERQVEMIENKAEKAKARAAEKRAAGDELRGVIKSVLTDEFQTADVITSQIDGEDVTRAKVIARLGQLVKNGEAEKTDVKTDDNRTVKAYKLAE